MKLKMKLRNETKSCYRFERRSDQGDLVTLYLKKKDVNDAGIDPRKGITVTIKEDDSYSDIDLDANGIETEFQAAFEATRGAGGVPGKGAPPPVKDGEGDGKEK